MRLPARFKSLMATVFLSQSLFFPSAGNEDANPTFGELSARIDDLENQLNNRGGRVNDANPGMQVTPEDIDQLRDEIRNLRANQPGFAEIGRLQQEVKDLREEVRRLGGRTGPAEVDQAGNGALSADSGLPLPNVEKRQVSVFSSPGMDEETESILKLLEQAAPGREGEDREEAESALPGKQDAKLEKSRQLATRKAENASPELPAGDAQAQYNEAARLYEKGAYPEAERAFDYFIATYPRDSLIAQAQYGKANACLKQKKYKEAKALYVSAYRKNPKGLKAADCLLKLGETLAIQGKREDACTAWGKLTKDYPQMTPKMKTEMASLKKKHGCG